MSAPLRVLVLNERDTAHPRAGGAEVHLEELFARLVSRGWQVTHLASGFAGAAPEERRAGIRVRRRGPLPLYYPWAVATCARETRQGHYDVVVEFLNKVPFFSPLYAARPVVAVAHHLMSETAFIAAAWPIAAAVWSLERLLPWFYRRVPVLAISDSTRQDLIRLGLSGEDVGVSHCGIDPPTCSAPPIAERRAEIAYLGRLEGYKRIDVLLRAVARLAPRFRDLELWVIGKGGEREGLEQLATQLGLAERVHFTGFVSRAERDRLLAGCRVCVCPSAKEGWGLSVIDANALGVPVVASDAPGLRDSVVDGETGFLVPEGDVGAFAHGIERLLADDALAASMSKAAEAWAARFDWERSTDELAQVLVGATEQR